RDWSSDVCSSDLGEGKKYKDPKELAKAYANAEVHITELREKLDSYKTSDSRIDEVLEELRKSKVSTSPEHNSMEEPNVDVEEVVRKVLTAEEQKKLRQTNNVTAWNKLVEHYGSEREARNAINTFTQGKQNLIQLVDELGAADPEVCFTTISKSVAKRDDTPNLPGVENTQPATARVGSGE